MPLWCYLGGIPGAFTVLLAAITVNSPLSLSGSIVLMLAGQIVTGLIIDHFGLMGLTRRKVTSRDGLTLLLLFSGCIFDHCRKIMMLLFYITIALTNGICIIFSRSINGRLSQSSNAFYASLVNHIAGFIFLSVVVLFYLPQFPVTLNSIPLITFTGGIIGACFVVINSYILPLLGATLTTILAICGQVLSGFIIDIIQHGMPSHLLMQITGVILILLAIAVRYRK